MSYLALARKYRPRLFDDVRGQDHVVRALRHALDHDRLHPSILLTGTRGVGKTTLGRIIAKGLNCETGVSSQPCGQCAACREVDTGRFIDLIEIDAASRTKVDDTRQLLDNVAYAPVHGRYKVYLVDEVHMLSTASFNALLKTLEEPPPHIKFILATTDPQKLPITVLSRCLQFNLKRMPAGLIREVLAGVLHSEGLEGEAPALAAIARAADGSMRDGLSLLDQAIAYCGSGRLESGAVETMLGTVDRRILLELITAIATGNGDGLLSSLQALDAAAPDYAALIDAMAAALQRIAVLQILPKAADETDDDRQLLTLAGQLGMEDVQLYYQIAVHGRRDLPWAPDPRLGFEMTALRMYAFRPADPAAAMDLADPRSPDGATAPSAGTASQPQSTETLAALASDAVSDARAEPGEPGAGPWPQWVEELGLEGMARQLARHCDLVTIRDGGVLLRLEAGASYLLTEARRLEIERALVAHQAQPVSVRIEVVEGPVNAPVRREERKSAQRRQAAEASIDKDPVVSMLRESLGARVRPGSVRPTE